MSKSVLPVFSSKSFIVSGLSFRVLYFYIFVVFMISIVKIKYCSLHLKTF